MRINYETDPLKHYVRKRGWLRAAKQQKHVIGKRLKKIPLRYFTFCAVDAIDVFMLERAGILERSEKTRRLEGVYFCEQDFEDFGIIAELIGSDEQGFQGTFEDIVLFKDDEETEGKTLENEQESGNFYTPEIREKLRYKDRHYRLREAFPFDIINLDVCGVMFPPKEGVIAPLLESIIRILEWQTESRFSTNNRTCDQFTLFLTSHIDPGLTNRKAIQQLENRVSENLCISEPFKSAFVERYGHDQANQLVNEDFPEFFRVALFKFIIHKALSTELGWTVTSEPTYLYNRDDKWVQNKQYQIMHTVSVYRRIPNFQKRLDDPSRAEYIQSVTKLVNGSVEWVDRIIEDSDILRELKEDLNKIIELRDRYHNP